MTPPENKAAVCKATVSAATLSGDAANAWRDRFRSRLDFAPRDWLVTSGASPSKRYPRWRSIRLPAA